MNLDRLEVLGMIGFIKHVIPDSEDSGKNCLFVRVEQDRVICTGGGEHAAKKVVLVRYMDMEEAAKTKTPPPKTFMIPKGTLESFETLMQRHKKKCKKLAKNDPSHLYIDITNEELESHGVVLRYPQPIYQFKDMEGLFQKKQAPITDLNLLPGDVSDVMSGFKKSAPVKITLSADGNPIHFYQPATEYEAILIPPPDEDPEPLIKTDDD